MHAPRVSIEGEGEYAPSIIGMPGTVVTCSRHCCSGNRAARPHRRGTKSPKGAPPRMWQFQRGDRRRGRGGAFIAPARLSRCPSHADSRGRLRIETGRSLSHAPSGEESWRLGRDTSRELSKGVEPGRGEEPVLEATKVRVARPPSDLGRIDRPGHVLISASRLVCELQSERHGRETIGMVGPRETRVADSGVARGQR